MKHSVICRFTSDDFSPKKILIVLLLYAKKMKCHPTAYVCILRSLKKIIIIVIIGFFVNNCLFKFLYDAIAIFPILIDK